MDRWANKVAVVTGAGSGIGAQMCIDLCRNNITVIGLDYNPDYLEKTASTIVQNIPSARFSSIVCDLTQESNIKSAFEQILANHEGVDILVNSAGYFHDVAVLEEGGLEALTKTVQTNLIAVISCTKKAFVSMAERNVPGQIINVCSVAGHTVLTAPGLLPATVYYATKSAVKTLNQLLGQELLFKNNDKIRISNISPALVGGTNLLNSTGHKAILECPNKLAPKDISETMLFILSAPQHVHIREVIMESVGAMGY